MTAVADVDGSNTQDVLLAGQDNFDALRMRLYVNQRVVTAVYQPVDAENTKVELSPNPIHTGQLQVRVPGARAAPIRADLHATSGSHQVNLTVRTSLNSEGTACMLSIPELPAGIYFLRLQYASGAVATARLVISR